MPTAEFTPIVITHIAAASSALILGCAMMWRRKGDILHRYVGRGWMLLMAITALSSFAIKTSGHFSWIHLLSISTLFGIYGAIYFARTGNIQRHRRVVKGLFFGGLVVAGLFTLLPQRLLGSWVWHTLGVL